MRSCLLLALLAAVAQCTELSALRGTSPVCPESRIVPLVSQCAKRSQRFLRCVARGNAGSARQCDCILQNEEVQDCIGNCLAAVYDLLCQTAWAPRKVTPCCAAG
jgi:hypothetical protein